ncbi:MAG TPA: hypothetical protein VN673_08010, partial [Clostridia bacterium]|nr:hypothetical protein [Clostridia bacterium]
MDHASSGAPADAGWLSQAIKYAHLTALACAKNPLQARWAWVLFVSLVGMLPSAAKSNAELHLPATGPTLLRFIAFSNKTNAFRWPPLMP